MNREGRNYKKSKFIAVVDVKNLVLAYQPHDIFLILSVSYKFICLTLPEIFCYCLLYAFINNNCLHQWQQQQQNPTHKKRTKTKQHLPPPPPPPHTHTHIQNIPHTTKTLLAVKYSRYYTWGMFFRLNMRRRLTIKTNQTKQKQTMH